MISSIWAIDGTLTCTTNLSQRGHGNNVNERVFQIFKALEFDWLCFTVYYVLLFNAEFFLYKYIKYIWFVKKLFIGNIFYTSLNSFVCTQLNDFNYYYLTLITLFAYN